MSIVYPKEVKAALKHVIEHHPDIVGVMFYPHGDWLYFTNDQDELVVFGDEIDKGLLEDAADAVDHLPALFSIHDPRYTGEGLWDCDAIQFARLIAEAEAYGLFACIQGLCENMDLDESRVSEIIERAQKVFDDHLESMR